MQNLYPYLIASLPMLHGGMKPPFSSEIFLEKCREFIPEKDFKSLCQLPKTEEVVLGEIHHPLIKEWMRFDTHLRNELVKIRASHKHIDPAKYLRPDGYAGPGITHLALEAYRNTSLIEAERFLDQQRWKVLEEHQTGHYFDLEFLIVYAYKLRLLERWERIRLADEEALLEKELSF